MAQIKVGFIGYGGSAKIYHLPYVLPVKELEVYAFLQRRDAPPKGEGAKGSHCTVDFPNVKHYRTPEEFFADQAIELVIVTTHTDTHGHFAELALKAGKNVVVEKPFTETSEEADKLISLAKETGKILTVYQNRRWDGEFLTLRHLVEKGAFGTLAEAEIHYDFENPVWMMNNKDTEYKPGAGMMFGLGSHSFDQALLLFGRPKSVTAFLRSLRGIESEIDDTFTVILQYESPLLVTVKTSVISCLQQDLKYFVRGNGGTYIKYGDDIQERQTISGMSYNDPKFGVNLESEYGTLTTYKQFDQSQTYDEVTKKYVGKFPTSNGYHRGYYETLADTIRRGTPLQVNPQDSRDGIRIMELARESHTTGRTVAWS